MKTWLWMRHVGGLSGHSSELDRPLEAGEGTTIM